MCPLYSAAFLFHIGRGAVHLDLAVWLILENNIADNVALVCYGLEALLRRLTHFVTTYTLGIATLIIATIPPNFFYFLFLVWYITVTLLTIFPFALLGPLIIISWLAQLITIRDRVKARVQSFLDHNIDKSTRQLVGVINTQDNEPVYGHSALCSSSRQIRILTLQAGCFSCPIECRLSVASLGSEDVNFEALSYVWGAHMFGSRIMVNGIPVVVKPNLFAALCYLRRRNCDRNLWIDALCINQANHKERARHVALMGDIYRSARRVVVWLGINSLTTRVLFRRNSASESSAKKVHFGSFRAVSKVLSVPWWTRIWVVQEVSLARDVVLQSGPECITWLRFCTVVDHVLQHKIFEKSNKIPFVAEYQSVKELRSRMSSDSLLERRAASCDLLRLVHDFRRREATIPIDKLFALYGLVDEEEDPTAVDLRPWVTYDNTSTEDFYFWSTSAEFAARCIERFQDLSVLALSEAFRPQQILSRPTYHTWFPLWSSTPNDFTTTPFWIGCAGDATLQWQRRFSASGGLSAPPCRRYEPNRLIRDTIRVHGWLVDTIDRVGIASTSSILPIMFSGFDGMSYRRIFDVFRSRVQWRSALHQWEGMALAACLTKDEALKRYHRTITAGLFDSIPSREGGTYWEVLDKVCPGKYFFVTRSGRFGLATAFVEPGQEVWVLMGSAVPMILEVRKESLPERPGKTKGYDFDLSVPEAGLTEDEFDIREYICQAYIDDLMVYSGNVKDDLMDGKIPSEDIYLG